MPVFLVRFFDSISPQMLDPTVNVFELIVRGVIVYFFMLVILRVTGKRQVGQLAPFDLVLLLVLSNAVQNAMNGGDNSLTAGIISAMTLIVCNGIMSRLTAKSKWLEGLIEGRPVVLVHGGTVDQAAMKKEQITHHELMAALRNAGCASLADVHFAVLENSGHISVVPRHERSPQAVPDSLPSH